MNRPIKKIAFKRNIAIPITAAAVAASTSAPAFGNAGPLPADSVDIEDEPIRTSFNFEHDSTPATSAFLGKPQRPAHEDRERVRLEDFPDFEYVPWNGRYAQATSGLRARH